MTAVLFPGILPATAGIRPARVHVHLVDTNGQPIIGVKVSDGSAVLVPQRFLLGAEPITLDLVPQSDIGTSNGLETWYQVVIDSDGDATTFRVQVPDLADIVPFTDLIGASGVSPGDILAGRLLPPIANTPNGYVATVSDGAAIWAPSSGSGGSGAIIQFTQAMPLAVWSIMHNLGRFPAAVQVCNPSGDVVLAEVKNYSVNEIRIHFGSPMAGTAQIS